MTTRDQQIAAAVIDLDALQALAEAATPGPWAMQQDAFDNDGVPESPVTAMDGKAFVAVTLDFGPNNPLMREANALYIAAANPAAILSLIDRLRKAEAASKWQPIETAPKHTEVLVWREDSGAFIAKFVTPEAVITIEEMERERLEFPDDFEEWYSDAYGWQEGSERPTHWMPLPAAPDSADSAKEK